MDVVVLVMNWWVLGREGCSGLCHQHDDSGFYNHLGKQRQRDTALSLGKYLIVTFSLWESFQFLYLMNQVVAFPFPFYPNKTYKCAFLKKNDQLMLKFVNLVDILL